MYHVIIARIFEVNVAIRTANSISLLFLPVLAESDVILQEVDKEFHSLSVKYETQFHRFDGFAGFFAVSDWP